MYVHRTSIDYLPRLKKLCFQTNVGRTSDKTGKICFFFFFNFLDICSTETQWHITRERESPDARLTLRWIWLLRATIAESPRYYKSSHIFSHTWPLSMWIRSTEVAGRFIFFILQFSICYKSPLVLVAVSLTIHFCEDSEKCLQRCFHNQEPRAAFQTILAIHSFICLPWKASDAS